MKTINNRMFRGSCLAVAAVTLGVCSQQVAQAADATVANDGELAEVVVTAERRPQRLQDVPISATVLSADDLIKQGISNLNDIQQVAPSVAINTYNRSVFINIRGVGIAQSAPTSNPGVAYYIDGQLIPHEQFIGQSFYDIGSIEVLRGPQGTLTGQNSTGGAVYVRSPDPKFSNYSATVDETYGNYAWVRSVVSANLGFTDNVALRVAAVHETRNSFSDNIGPSGSEPGNNSFNAVRMNLALRSSDDRLKGNIRYEYFALNYDNNAVKNRNDQITSDPFTIEEDGRSFERQNGFRLGGEIHYGITDTIEIRGSSSWQKGFTKDQTDGDRTATAPPQPPTTNTGRVSNARTDFHTFINEVDLLSKDTGPLKWVVGVFDLDEKVPVALLRDNRHTTDFVASNSTIIADAWNTSMSGFGQVNYFVTEPIELLAGARYSKDKQTYNRIALPGPPIAPGTDRIGPAAESSEVTGKVGVNYHLNSDSMFYLTGSRGYKAGGVNLTLGTPNFSPELNAVYEAGFKATFNRHLRINADVFHSNYHNIQLQTLLNGLPLTQTAASGKSNGGELEITSQFDAFAANLGFSYLDATFVGDATLQNLVTNQAQVVRDGDRLPFSPKFTVNAGLQYAFKLGTTQLTPRVQWSYQAEQLATPFASSVTIVPSHGVAGAQLAFEQNDKWRVEGFVENFTNKVYVASQIQNSSSADGGILYGAPRQFGVRVIGKIGN
jgi:iron complex outermembrane recepter protein